MVLWGNETTVMRAQAIQDLNRRALAARFVPVAGDNGHIVTRDGHRVSFNRATVDWTALADTIIRWHRLCQNREGKGQW